MKKILGIILLSIIFFCVGAISGTGGIDTKTTAQNIDSLQTKTIVLGYNSTIEIWTSVKHSEVFLMASLENINETINRFRDDQLKLAVAGFVNYKSANNRERGSYSSDKQSELGDERNIPAINQNADFPPNQDIIFKPTQIIDSTTDTSTDALINSPQINRNTDVRNEIVE
jgi:hypothetical protein